MEKIIVSDKYIYVPIQGTKSTIIIPTTAVVNGDVHGLLRDFVPGGVVLLNSTDGVMVVRNKSIKKFK